MPPNLDPSTVATSLEEGFSQLTGTMIEEIGGVVSAGVEHSLAAAYFPLPIAFTGLIQQKAVELGISLDERLPELIEKLDEDDPKQAALARGLYGLMRCLPDSDLWEPAIIQTASGDSQALVSLLETYQSDQDRRNEFETTIEQVFRGEFDSEDSEHETFLDYLQDVFEVDSRDDALATFLDVRDMMASREIHQLLENTTAIQVDFDELERTIEETSNDLEATLFEADLRREGFTRLSPYYFKQRDSDPPVTSWRAGFDLAAVYDGQALERDNPGEDDRRKVWKELANELEDGEDRVVLGRPGTGKSTICKTVARHWYEDRRGTVFYRGSDTGQRFTETGALEERIRDAEGHVLVVVEDAARESANEIFRTMLHFDQDSSVSFLLDSRVEEWKDATREFTNPQILNLKEELTEYQVPDFDDEECARAIRLFENLTGHSIIESPQELLAEIETDMGAGEMYLLGYRLSSYGVNPITVGDSAATGLRSEVQRVHTQLAERQNELAREVGMMINILNAGELALYPEFIHALASTDTEHGQIETLLDQLTGYLLFERGNRYQSNHPFWSTQFLSYALEQESRRSVHLFEDCLNALFELIDEPEKRNQVRQWLRGDAEYLSEIEDDPQSIADSLVQDIFELGQRQPGLARLFGTVAESNISLPDACSRGIALRCIKWRGEMHLEAGAPDIAEGEFQRLLDETRDDDILTDEERTMLIGQGYLSLGEVSRKRGLLDEARERLEQSIEIFEEIDNKRWKARSLAELGTVDRRGGKLDQADTHYDECIELCNEVGYRFGEAKALNNRGMVEKDRGNLEAAQADLERAIELKRDSGHRRKSIAISINTLGEIFYQQGALENAQQQLQQSLRIKREVGYQSGCAWSLYYLGLVAERRGDLERAKEHLNESLSIRREIDNELGIGRCLNALGEVHYLQGALDQAEEYHEESLTYLESVGDKIGQARYEVNIGNIEYERGNLSAAQGHFQTAAAAFDEIGNNRGLARSHRGLGRVAERLNRYDEAREHLVRAVEELTALSDTENVIETMDELIDVCEEADEHIEAVEWQDKKTELRDQR